MGQAKENLLNCSGQTLLRSQLQRLAPHFSHTFVLTGDKSADELQLDSQFDAVLDPEGWIRCGPVAGLVAGLEFASTDWLVLLGVDQPFYPWELAHAVERTPPAVIFREPNGQLQWLGGLFHRTVLSPAREFLDGGGRSFRDFVGSLEATVVECHDERAFLNINTPEEARKAGFRLCPP